MKENKKILEKDLYKPIHDYFTEHGYEVHGEVKGCDITVSKGNDLIIIELKRNMSLKLLIQAAKRQRMTNSVYIAIPQPKYSVFSRKWKDLCYILRRLELGLITVSFTKDRKRAQIQFDPSPFDKQKSMGRSKKQRANLMKEIDERHKNYNEGGTNKTKIMTAYRETAVHIACCLNKVVKASPRELRELGTGNKTQSILYKNFYGWFEREERGVYKLSERGHEVFSLYPELVEYYNGKISEKMDSCNGSGSPERSASLPES